MRKTISMIVPLLFLHTGYVHADSGKLKVTAMLKNNPVVKAAVAQAKKFSGSKACGYRVESRESPEFEKGTTFDYSAEITCIHGEEGGVVQIKGRMFYPSDGPQEMTLNIRFAG
jgi:hypothetical protein